MQQSTFIGRYLPQRFSDRNGACQRGVFCSSVPVGNNQTLVTGIPGKCLYVPWLTILAGVNAAYVRFETASGAKLDLRVPADTTAVPNIILPFNEAGWIDTLPGESILVDVFDSASVISFQWFAYLP